MSYKFGSHALVFVSSWAMCLRKTFSFLPQGLEGLSKTTLLGLVKLSVFEYYFALSPMITPKRISCLQNQIEKKINGPMISFTSIFQEHEIGREFFHGVPYSYYYFSLDGCSLKVIAIILYNSAEFRISHVKVDAPPSSIRLRLILGLIVLTDEKNVILCCNIDLSLKLYLPEFFFISKSKSMLLFDCFLLYTYANSFPLYIQTNALTIGNFHVYFQISF